jgi:hypothetical protein
MSSASFSTINLTLKLLLNSSVSPCLWLHLSGVIQVHGLQPGQIWAMRYDA